MKLHIVRHGETIWHAENRYAGHTDVPLTEEGLKQAQLLVNWAEQATLDVVATSDLSRAVNTARPLADAIGVELQQFVQLREVDFGECDGLTEAEMRSQFPIARQQFEKFPATSPLPGGERGIDAIARALPVIAEFATQNENVLLVIHSTLGRLLLCEFLGIDPNRYRTLFPRFVNGAVTTLELPKPHAPADLKGTAALLALNSAVSV